MKDVHIDKRTAVYKDWRAQYRTIRIRGSLMTQMTLEVYGGRILVCRFFQQYAAATPTYSERVVVKNNSGIEPMIYYP